MSMNNTPHQERSHEALDNQYVQWQIKHKNSFTEELMAAIHQKVMTLCIRDLQKYLNAKEKGSGTGVTTTFFHN